jgi:hypothetical protein
MNRVIGSIVSRPANPVSKFYLMQVWTLLA